ncbi:MAG: hypothetical protein KAT18_08015 [Candidatus Latescibacteria bacterium]|nr:hypothetical protein [Candidatus Latescibacterota bacterium]
MKPEIALFFDGRKFMWDEEAYDTREAAEAKMQEYEDKEFETQLVEKDDEYLVYNRRVAKEVVVEGTPPP